MFCRKCGSPINEGEKFCSVCGEKVDNGVPAEQNAAPPSLDQQPYGQQPYAQQPYGQQPYGQQPYAQQPKKSMKWLWITLSLVAVAAIAAVLIFVVLPGNQQPTMAAEGPWPFKGGTPQTEFVNETVKVFSDAFAGFGDENSGIKELAKQPFDVNMDIDMKMMGQTANVTLDAAYDNETLGVNVNAMGTSVKMLLLENVFYMDTFGSVSGIKFGSSGDLSKPMSLEDRVKSLVEGLGMQQSTLSEEDYIAIAELFVNSIDQSCFTISDSKATLTLHADDIAKILKTFASKLDTNKELKDKLEKYIQSTSGTTVDVVEAINSAAETAEAQSGSTDFELVWEVKKEGGKPVSLEITVDVDGQKYIVSFGYEKDGDTVHITLEIVTGDSSVGTISGEFNYKKTGTGIEYDGSITAQGQTMKLEGSEKKSGDKANGEVLLTVPGAGEMTIQYDSELSIGMPSKKVKDDSRFTIDTSNANITDAASTGSYPLFLGDTTIVNTEPTGTPEYTFNELEDKVWESANTSGGGMTTLGEAVYFLNGRAYFGMAGSSKADIVAYSSGQGELTYTFDGYTIHITGNGFSVDYYYTGSTVLSPTGEELYPRFE